VVAGTKRDTLYFT